MAVAAGARVLVTGGTGMIGSHLVRRLLGDGAQVAVVARPNGSRIRLRHLEDRVEVLDVDISDGEAVRAAVIGARPQIVFHLASTPFNPPSISSQEHLRVNLHGMVSLLEALRELPGTRVIFTGTAAQYGSGSRLKEDAPPAPGTLLGASKACASIILKTFAVLHGLSTVELRLFTPYGPWEHPRRLIPQTILAALARRDLPMSRGEQQRDFVYIDDVIDALVLAATKPLPSGSVFNIGSGKGVSIRQVVELVLSLMGDPVKPLVGALPTRPDEIMEMSADTSAARRALGWQPCTPLEDGLRRSIEWFSNNRDVALELT